MQSGLIQYLTIWLFVFHDITSINEINVADSMMLQYVEIEVEFIYVIQFNGTNRECGIQFNWIF